MSSSRRVSYPQKEGVTPNVVRDPGFQRSPTFPIERSVESKDWCTGVRLTNKEVTVLTKQKQQQQKVKELFISLGVPSSPKEAILCLCVLPKTPWD